MPELADILKACVQHGASDILIAPGEPPVARIAGTLRKYTNLPKADAAECKRWIYSILDERKRAEFEKHQDLDCSIHLPEAGRFRVNVFMQLNGPACAMRVISTKIPSPDEIKLSPSIQNLSNLPRGLVLVTGPTGSGKTTTLACLIDLINQRYAKHILTIEDPIEYVYQNKLSVIEQRNVGLHTASWHAAVRGSLRQNPDVILIGEMRDAETMGMALAAAETGHLCFSTLHTNDAPSTIDRIINEFPLDAQNKVRSQIGSVLQAVVSQVLVPRGDGKGRACAREVMLMTSGVAAQIREGKIHELYSTIESGADKGMVSLDKALIELIRAGKITMESALEKAHDPDGLKKLYKLQVGETKIDMSSLGDPLAQERAAAGQPHHAAPVAA